MFAGVYFNSSYLVVSKTKQMMANDNDDHHAEIKGKSDLSSKVKTILRGKSTV